VPFPAGESVLYNVNHFK